VKGHFSIVAQYDTAKTVNITKSIHRLNETNAKLMETQDLASLKTHNLGVLAKQLETLVDAISSTSVPTAQHAHTPETVELKTTFKRLKPQELDQLGFDVAELHQLTHDDIVAKQAVADAQATSMATSACYITTCLHAEQVERALERATIILNLRQGQANSHDAVNFATTEVHDPADYSFLGSEPTPLEEHISPEHHNKPPPPSPPSAPRPPPSCPLPPLKYDLNFISKKQLHIQWFKSLTPEETTHLENLIAINVDNLVTKDPPAQQNIA
jgi:DNA segregation ATPase FtsK/SpoIIIE-like protein